MKSRLSVSLLLVILAWFAPAAAAQPYEANEESLAGHNAAPEWFRDAKFGIYFHWGPYAVPAYGGEWYPRWMHFENLPVYQANNDDIAADYFEHHVKTWGHPTEFGYHDFVPMFTAENFDADEWADLFAASGAQFAGPVGEHHDGFSMWDSDVTPWNAADMGPKRDIAGEIAAAVRERGMKFAISFHHARNLQRYRGQTLEEQMASEDAQGNMRRTYWDSHYPWFEGQPQTSDDPDLRLLYGNLPEAQWLEEIWLGKLKEVVDKYQPDLIWFDSWLDEIPESARYEFVAYYLNSARDSGADVVITRKQDDLPLSFSVVDYEKGRANKMSPFPFLTDDTISLGSWSYTESLRVKSLERVLHDFIDLVSKNGQLLLNLSPKADGSIPENQRDVLLGLGEWLKINGEAIYNTRPWTVFGEGPARLEKGGHFVGELVYSSEDIRFTANGPDIYVTVLGSPVGETVTVQSMSANLTLLDGQIESISLLGSDSDIDWSRDAAGLHIKAPASLPSELANVWKVTVSEQE